jgi:hypothetical protein
VKFIEHHAIVWNDKGWQRPSGGKPRLPNKPQVKRNRNSEYYVLESGYGHEEWNHNRQLVKNGWRGFHTAAATSFYEQIPKDAQLAILITSQERGLPRKLVGVAVNVTRADEEFRASLKLKSLVNDLWCDPVIWETIWRRRKGTSENRHKKKLLADWRRGGLQQSLMWKCRTGDFWWPSIPIPLSGQIKTASGSSLTHRMSQSQSVKRSATLLKLLRGAPKSIHSWFDESEVFGSRSIPTKRGRAAAKNGKRRATGGSSGDDYIRYIQAHVRKVFARHTPLQEDFEEYCPRLGFDLDVPADRIDIIAHHRSRGRTLIEVKPTRTSKEAFFAIRLAIGQLFDYEWYDCLQSGTGNSKPSPGLLVVLDTEPAFEALSFAHSLGVAVAWRKKPHGKAFEIRWPRKSSLRFVRR